MNNNIEEENKMSNENMSSDSGNDQQSTETDQNLSGVETEEVRSNPKQKMVWVATLIFIALVGLIGIAFIVSKRSATAPHSDPAAGTTISPPESKTGREVSLNAEMLRSVGIVTETVTQRPAVAKMYVTGTVELNPEKTEMATTLVGGRIERVFYGVGDYVNQGATLAFISSPQLAQLHGKMHEARTKYELAARNLVRVQKAENRVFILQAKAKLDLAESTLKRTQRLIELGAGAGKDLIAAETNFKTAKAEYDFQSNISLNKEIQEAKADVETTEVDLSHIQDEMRSLGVPYDRNRPDDHSKDTSLVALRAPLSGMITERKFNSGAGVEAATAIFAISNLSTVYVIANVPEASASRLSIGSVAEIKSAAVGTLNGRISYIDPSLDETTRTARVRLEVPNDNGRLRAGMFTDIGFYVGTSAVGGEELVVATAAVQRSGDKTMVFVPKENSPGVFEVREVETGGEIEGYTRIISGLKLGEKIVTKGSFTLKTQLEKGAMKDE